MTRRPISGGRRHPALAAVLVFVAVLAVSSACDWLDRSSDEATSEAGTALEQAVASSMAASSFHAVQETTGDVLGADVTSRTDIYYQAPDSVRWLSDRRDGPFQEAVLIGDRAWIRNAAGWTTADPAAVRPVLLSPLQALEDLPQSPDIQVVGNGPEMMGEPTTRYRLTRPDFGDTVLAQLGMVAPQPASAAAVAGLRDAYQDVTAVFVATIGEQSRRIYDLEVTQQGPNQDIVSRTTFEYGKPVVIEPPIP